MRITRNLARATTLAWLLAGLGPPLATPVAAQETPRIVAIGDVHGAYDSFVALLQAANLVDADLEWTGGDRRLIVLGDLVDRGEDSRAALELMMKLQASAARAGGAAELLLGNHEVMNLTGDLRYVATADFATYSAEESPAERAAAWERFRKGAAGSGRAEVQLAAEFARRYPPGFFGQRAAFSPHGRFGAWLLDRPVLATIEHTAFVHGGLSTATAGRTAAEIDREYHDALREYLSAVEALTAAGVLHVEDTPDERLAIAQRWAATAAANTAQPVRHAAEQLASSTHAVPFRSDAVFWYRGTAACSAASESARLQRQLAALGVDRLVIGHTPTVGAEIVSRFDGAVIRIDTGIVGAPRTGRPSALVIHDATVRALYLDPDQDAAPRVEPRRVGTRIGNLTDTELEQLLLNAPVTARTARSDGTELLQLEQTGLRVTAVFRPAATNRSAPALPEVAAYRLDRLLELDLVPVTVRRALDDHVGSLQLDVTELPDDARRVAEGAGAESWCPLQDQFNLMYAFDWLAGNPGRSRDEIRYVPEGWRLVLTGNRRLFGLGTDAPTYLRATRIEIPGRLGARLKNLSTELLATELGDVLDERQRGAILARRDRLLAPATRR